MKIDKKWLSGFCDGEACFYIGINKTDTHKLGYQVLFEFSITQHKRDIQLLQAIRKFFKCGVVGKDDSSEIYIFRIRKLETLKNTIIPFFESNKLLTCKRFDFEKFKQAYSLIDSDPALTEENLNKIRKIKETMNRKAIIFDEEMFPSLLKNKESI